MTDVLAVTKQRLIGSMEKIGLDVHGGIPSGSNAGYSLLRKCLFASRRSLGNVSLPRRIVLYAPSASGLLIF